MIHDSLFVPINLNYGSTKSIYHILPSKSLFGPVNVETCGRWMNRCSIGRRGEVIGFGVTKASLLLVIHLVVQLS